MKISIKTMPIGKVLLFLSLVFLLVRCNKEEELDTPLTKPLSETLPDNTPIEKEVKRIYDQYGVLIEHNYDRNAFSQGATANPVKEKDIIPYIKMLEELLFRPLNQATGSDKYVKKQLPIRIYLIGNAIGYGGKSGKEETAGQAGNIQPNRLTLGGITDFGYILRNGTDEQFLSHLLEKNLSSIPEEGGMVGFIYHEYTHFMDAKHDIPRSFEQPALNNYLRGTNAWQFKDNQYAREKGFMLPYGMQNEAEDFATYVQIMVSKVNEEVEQNYLLNGAAQEKYQLVHEYYKSFGLNLFKLQKVLYSDELKQRLLAIKHQYDGTDKGNTNRNARKKIEDYFSARKKYHGIMGRPLWEKYSTSKENTNNMYEGHYHVHGGHHHAHGEHHH